MSNYVTIQPTVFRDYGTEEESFGVRVFDNYGQTYDNTWENIPDDDLEILQKVIDNGNEVIVSIIDFLIENGVGIYIGKEYYEWKDIKHLFPEP